MVAITKSVSAFNQNIAYNRNSDKATRTPQQTRSPDACQHMRRAKETGWGEPKPEDATCSNKLGAELLKFNGRPRSPRRRIRLTIKSTRVRRIGCNALFVVFRFPQRSIRCLLPMGGVFRDCKDVTAEPI